MLRRTCLMLVFVMSTLSIAEAGKIYWISDTAGIYRAEIDGTNIEQVVKFTTPGNHGHGLAIDTVAHKMYWCQETILRRANLEIPAGENFENRTDIEDLALLGGNPGDIAIDVSAGKIYWGNDSCCGPGGGLHRANLDGSAAEIVIADVDGAPRIRGLALSNASAGAPAVSTFGLVLMIVLGTVASVSIFRRTQHPSSPTAK